MHPVTGSELATARINVMRPAVRRHRFGKQLWALLSAQVLLDGPAAAAGSTSVIEDDYRRLAARRQPGPGPAPTWQPNTGQADRPLTIRTETEMTTTTLPAASAQVAAAGYTRRRRQLTVLVVALAFVMDLMDATILTIALPTIQRHMHASLPAVNWMATAYPLAFAVLLITGGRLGDVLGYRRLFLAGVSMFLAASVLVGTAWSPDILITARVLQGAAAALMVPLSYKMPTYQVGNRRLHLGVWKHGVSLYGWKRQGDGGFTARHPDLQTSTGTIRIRSDAAAAIPDDDFRDLARAVLASG